MITSSIAWAESRIRRPPSNPGLALLEEAVGIERVIHGAPASIRAGTPQENIRCVPVCGGLRLRYRGLQLILPLESPVAAFEP